MRRTIWLLLMLTVLPIMAGAQHYLGYVWKIYVKGDGLVAEKVRGLITTYTEYELCADEAACKRAPGGAVMTLTENHKGGILTVDVVLADEHFPDMNFNETESVAIPGASEQTLCDQAAAQIIAKVGYGKTLTTDAAQIPNVRTLFVRYLTEKRYQDTGSMRLASILQKSLTPFGYQACAVETQCDGVLEVGLSSSAREDGKEFFVAFAYLSQAGHMTWSNMDWVASSSPNGDLEKLAYRMLFKLRQGFWKRVGEAEINAGVGITPPADNPVVPGVVSGRIFLITQGGDLKPARMAHVYLLWCFSSLEFAQEQERKGIHEDSADLVFIRAFNEAVEKDSTKRESVRRLNEAAEKMGNVLGKQDRPWRKSSESIICTLDLIEFDTAIRTLTNWRISNGKTQVLAGDADEDGYFKITGVPPGVYDLVARGRAGFNDAAWSVGLSFDSTGKIIVPSGKELVLKLSSPVKACPTVETD